MQRSVRVSKELKPQNFSLGLKKARKSLDLDIPNFETNEGIISVSVLTEKKNSLADHCNDEFDEF